ncbi:MAG TPA: hypothetical protein VJ276_10935 [Thermoanaerobaculia bacterium]|nr:hypothetical protein [Thermoanaerobaculia bacterium]
MSEFSSPPTAPSVRLPADYYCAPSSEIRPIFPRWVPLGCGSASVAFVVLLFAGGVWVQHGGLEKLMDFALGMMTGEMAAVYDKDVSDAEKQALSEAMAAYRANIRTDKVPLLTVQPVMDALQPAIADKRLTREEIRHLTETIRKANVPPPPRRRAAS